MENLTRFSGISVTQADQALLSSHLPWPCRRGKVRDVYDMGDRLLIVSTDRISAFDWVLPSGIPDKGRVLTQLSRFWFEKLTIKSHYLTCEVPSVGNHDSDGNPYTPSNVLEGRCMIVNKAQVVPFECVVRGFLEGSGWKEYQQTSSICGIPLPAGLQQCSRLSEPIFTPATKAESGHDENVSFQYLADKLGSELASQLRDMSLQVYQFGQTLAEAHGIIVADTKFEWGWFDGGLILIDEVLTPDSSRFWPADRYQPGRSQLSYDKQFVREWLLASTWDRNSPPPTLPPDVILKTREKYIEAFEQLTTQRFAWK